MAHFEAEAARQGLPEVILSSSPSSTRRPRLVATGFATTLERAFSGSSYYLSQAGMAERVLDGCFTLQSTKRSDPLLNAAGAMWKLGRVLRGRKPGGFKFAPSFHAHIWRKHAKLLAGTAVINNIQMYGPEFWKRQRELDIRPYFYIDGTLSEYFTNYADFDVVAAIDKQTMRNAIAVEREDYARVEHVFAMSRRSADDLINTYGLPSEKISIVSPGANIADAEINGYVAPPQAERRDFIVGFVGLYARRKGLDRLAAAVAILRSRGLPVVLRVVGECPGEIRAMDGVEALGVIRKDADTARFLASISDIDLGCQLSKAEMVGVAMLEFLRLGIPILATDVGGIPEVMAGGGGIMVQPEVSPEELAGIIGGLVRDRDSYLALRKAARMRRDWASWSRAAREMDVVLSRGDTAAHRSDVRGAGTRAGSSM